MYDMKEITIVSTDGLTLSALYSKAENAKGLVQIIHGMVEHKERYIDFINFLVNAGYTCIISDNRGHGKSVNDEFPLGHMGDIEQMVKDQYMVTKYIKKKHPDLPLYLFGHSMGSLIAREYVAAHDDEIVRCALSGTVAYNPGAGLGVFLASLKKKRGYSKLLWALSNGLSFKEDLSWLSYNQENITKYKADPLCQIKFTNFSNKILFKMTGNLHKKKRYQCKNPDLRIRSFSGADDRTTAGTKGCEDSVRALRRAGYMDVSYIEYPDMKHEILNEDGKEKVYKGILDFYEEE